MPALTIAGIEVRVAEMTETEPVEVGDEGRSFSGKLRSTISAEKRAWDMETSEITAAEHTTLRAAIAGGAHVTVAGDLVGSPVICRVKVKRAPFVRTGATFVRTLSLTIQEV